MLAQSRGLEFGFPEPMQEPQTWWMCTHGTLVLTIQKSALQDFTGQTVQVKCQAPGSRRICFSKIKMNSHRERFLLLTFDLSSQTHTYVGKYTHVHTQESALLLTLACTHKHTKLVIDVNILESHLIPLIYVSALTPLPHVFFTLLLR